MDLVYFRLLQPQGMEQYIYQGLSCLILLFLLISSGMLMQFISACKGQHQVAISGSFQFSPSLVLKVRQMLDVLGLLGSTSLDFIINLLI